MSPGAGRLTTRALVPPLWLRAVAAIFLLPGMVAGVIPAWIVGGEFRLPLGLGALRWAGLLPLALGITVLLLTFWDFFAVGRGTLAPWDPPRALVHRRLYSRVRNPMYLGVLATLAGEALLRSSGGLLIYLGGIALAFHLRVVLYEEPALSRQFGASFAAYLEQVPRWIPRWGGRPGRDRPPP